jgi:hypothetical protein
MNLQNQPDSCLSPSLLAPPGRALVAPAAISSHFEAVFLRYLLAVKTSPVFKDLPHFAALGSVRAEPVSEQLHLQPGQQVGGDPGQQVQHEVGRAWCMADKLAVSKASQGVPPDTKQKILN